jgi:hypothetical protein
MFSISYGGSDDIDPFWINAIRCSREGGNPDEMPSFIEKLWFS